MEGSQFVHDPSKSRHFSIMAHIDHGKSVSHRLTARWEPCVIFYILGENEFRLRQGFATAKRLYARRAPRGFAN